MASLSLSEDEHSLQGGSSSEEMPAVEWALKALHERGFRALRGEHCDSILLHCNEASGKVDHLLRSHGVNSCRPIPPELQQYVEVMAGHKHQARQFIEAVDNVFDSPFEEQSGLLCIKNGTADALALQRRLLKYSVVARVFGEIVDVDHTVVCFPDFLAMQRQMQALVAAGGVVSEGPGLWPQDFCKDDHDDLEFPEDLAMHFASIKVPSGATLSLAAPHAVGDHLHRLVTNEAQFKGVHHVAIRVSDMPAAAARWRAKGFVPRGEAPQNDGKKMQWFMKNEAGQIVELLHRSDVTHKATFSCANFAGLRASE